MKAAAGGGAFTREKMIEFGGDSSKLGLQTPMILSLGPDTPSCPLGQPPHSGAGKGVTLSLVCGNAPIKVRGGTWGGRKMMGTSFSSGHTQS